MTPEGETVPGYEVAAVERWIAENVEGLTPPLRWTRLEGGHSNLTYLVADGTGSRAVVRRPPMGTLQPGAHDMRREYRIISALWPTPVPVARPHGECLDAAVTGATFYVMGFVDGSPLPTGDRMREWLPTIDMQRRCSESFIDVLAALHTLDPDDIGLGDLSRREDYVGRQLKAWYRSWTTSAADAGYDDPRVHEVHDLLQARKPVDTELRLVHGDYGLHNCIVGRDGAIAAVVDWEVATLGDALSDLAYVVNRWSVEGDEVPGRESITQPAGFMSRSDAIERYRSKTGADLTLLDFYIALNHWRSACIVHGVYTRYVRGQKPPEGVDLDGFWTSIGIRVDQAAEAAARL